MVIKVYKASELKSLHRWQIPGGKDNRQEKQGQEKQV